jgi:hypothetical protein
VEEDETGGERPVVETGGRDVVESPVELVRTLLVLVPLTGGLVGLGLIVLVLVFTFVLVFKLLVLVLTFLVLVLTLLVLVLTFLVLVLTFLVLVFTFFTVLVLGFGLTLDVLVFLTPLFVGPLPRFTLPGGPVTTGRELLTDTVCVTVTVRTL